MYVEIADEAVIESRDLIYLKQIDETGNIPKLTKKSVYSDPHDIIQYQNLLHDLEVKEFTSITKCTKHGIERLIERDFSLNEVLSLLEKPDYVRSQYNDLKTYIDKVGEKYNLIIFNENSREIITGLKNISLKKVNKLGKNCGWEL